MLVRVFLVLVLIAAFAVGFSNVVNQSDGLSSSNRTSVDCRDWNGPDCTPFPLR